VLRVQKRAGFISSMKELNLPQLSSEKNSPASDQMASSDSDGAA